MYRHKRQMFVLGMRVIALVLTLSLPLLGINQVTVVRAYTPIATDTTWNTDQTFDTDVVVQSGATLTIAGGTTTTFNLVANSPYAAGLSDQNELIVEQGGKLIVEQGATITGLTTADWYGIVFLPGSDGKIEGATIKNGIAGVTIIDASPSILDNWIRDMQGGGITIGSLGAGIIISGTSASLIENNHIDSIRGASGLSGSDGSGNNGWLGGAAVGIYVQGATPQITANAISVVYAGAGGAGGDGARGVDGGPGEDGSPGSPGGDGGLSGMAWGIRVVGPTASTTWGIYNNTIKGVHAGFGGSGGDAGDGGNGGDGVDGVAGTDGGDGGNHGNPGDGADGLSAYGIYIKDASPAVQDNMIRSVQGGYGGFAGWSSGIAGAGGDGGDATTGQAGDAGDGGDSCTDPAKAGDGGNGYGMLIEGASSPDVRHNTIVNVEGGRGGSSTKCGVGSGGIGGSGSAAGLGGSGGDSGLIRYTQLGHSGHGGYAFGVNVISATPTLARNFVYDITGGDAGSTWDGSNTMAGIAGLYGDHGGQASDAGPGAEGGNGGNAFGIRTNSTIRIENNIVHNIDGGEASDGSDGGRVLSSGFPADGGDGGEGGNGGSGWGIFADSADPEIVNNTVVDISLANKGLGGAGDTGYAGGAPGAPGDDGIPGRADGILMDNGARPPTVNNIVVQMTGATGYGISARPTQSGLELDYNVVWNWSLGNYNSVTPGAHGVIVNPQFVDWANDNFYLQSTSPAVDQGTNGSVSIPTDDRDGVGRPQDGDADGTATTDIGAYEYMTGTMAFEVTTSVGSWASDDGRLTLEWESGAVSSTVPLTYTPRGLTHPTSGLSFGGLGFSLEASGPVTINTSLTLTVHYDESLLAEGMDEETMEVYKWNAQLFRWEALDVISRDTTANTVTVRLDHLCDFALLGEVEISYKIYLPLAMRNASSQ